MDAVAVDRGEELVDGPTWVIGMVHLREGGAVVDTNSRSATLEQLTELWPGPSKS